LKNNIKLYFFEFTLLFLALYCGFLVQEYQEEKSDRDRELQYIKLFINELKIDSTNFERLLGDSVRWKGLDTLAKEIMKKPKNDFQYLKKLNILKNKYANTIIIYNPSKFTLNQFILSGNLRLIKSQKLIEKIVEYGQLLNEIELQSKYYEHIFNNHIDISAKVFNMRFWKYYQMNKVINEESIKLEDLILIREDEETIHEFANISTYHSRILKNYLFLIKNFHALNNSLITTIENEYDI
jgi:hypothetical protein